MPDYFDVATIRKQFAVTQRMLYFDSAHQTPLAANVRATLDAFYSQGYENAGPKPMWMQRVEEVRSNVATLLGASPTEIAFVKNTSEGLNIAANAIPFEPGDNVLMIEGDHPNNAYAWLNLRRKGVDVRFIPLQTPWADASTFEPFMDDRTRVISLSHVTFHAGQRHDIAAIGALCQQRGLYFVVDAMQSIGVIPIDAPALGISMLAAGCHKGLLVPQGLGILYADKALRELVPAYLAMTSLANPPADYIATPDDLAVHDSARRFEIGNYNLPDIHALGASLNMVLGIGVENVEQHVLDLGDRLIAHMDRLKVRIVGPRERAHRAHIYVLDLQGNDWLDYFAANNVRVSPERDGIRISFAMFNTGDEVDQVAAIIARGLDHFRSDAAATVPG